MGYKTTASVRKPDGSPRVDPLIQKRKHFLDATGDQNTKINLGSPRDF